VSQLEHALQCAQLACEAGAGNALVVAALLHDADLVAGHVAAKRVRVVGSRSR
jgi:predicted HD phosphohydrolase